MSQTKVLLKNYFSVFLLQLSSISVGLVLPKIILLNYGSEINGLSISITQFINYFILVEAGLSESAIFSLYKPLAENNIEKVSSILSVAKKFFFKSGMILVFLLITMSLIYPYFVNSSILSSLEISLIILVIGIPFLLNFFIISVYRVLLTADKKTNIVAFSTIIFIVTNACITIYLAVNNYGFLLVKTICICAALFQGFILFYYVKSNYPTLKLNSPCKKNLLNQRWNIFFTQILTTIHYGIPIVFATFLMPLNEISVYAIYNMLFIAVGGLISIFTNTITPFFGELYAKENTIKSAYVFNKLQIFYSIIITITFICLIYLVQPFILIYTRDIIDANYNQPIYALLLILMGLTRYLKAPFGTLMQSSGFFTTSRNQWIIQLSIAILLSFLFSRFYGFIGVLIAIIISNVYRDFALIIYITNKFKNIKIRDTLSNIIIMFSCIGISLILSTTFSIKLNTYIEFISYSLKIIFLSAAFVSSIFYICKKKEFLQLIKILVHFLPNINKTSKK